MPDFNAASQAQLQALINADPDVQKAIAAYNAAMAPVLKDGFSGQRLVNDPRTIAARNVVGQALTAAKTKLGVPEDYQINYDGQVQHIPQFTPNDLALTIGGTLATAGLLSGAGAGGSKAATSGITATGGASAPAATTPLASAIAGPGAFATPAAGAVEAGGEYSLLGSTAGAAVPAASTAVAPTLASTALATTPATAMASAAPVAATTASGAVPAATGGGMGFLDFLNSPAGKLVADAAGGAISAYGQAQQSDASRLATANATGAATMTAQGLADRGVADSAAARNPLGTEQNFAAKQAMKRAVFGAQRPISYARGTQQTNYSGIPEGGFDPAMLEASYGPASTLASITSNQKQLAGIDPAHAQTDFSSFGFDPTAAMKAKADVTDYQKGVQNTQASQRGAVANYLNANTAGVQPTPLSRAIVGTGNAGY